MTRDMRNAAEPQAQSCATTVTYEYTTNAKGAPFFMPADLLSVSNVPPHVAVGATRPTACYPAQVPTRDVVHSTVPPWCVTAISRCVDTIPRLCNDTPIKPLSRHATAT
jgi:hypothetical protein